jgi:ribosomal protein S18 acetylase RimI-like enzyme
MTAGNTAVVWPPNANRDAADALLQAAAKFCDERRVALSQLIIGDESGFTQPRLGACGFAKVADLLYLFSETGSRAARSPQGAASAPNDLGFTPRAVDDPARLATLIERTYEGTHDCPALDGLRNMDDVLAGYRAQGRYVPEHWYLVQNRASDLGVLILADHPGTGNWELVYMGVTPEARGAGLGRRIVEFALAAAARGGAERLVLAVDAANRPALAVYRAAGFIDWGHRTAYARMNRR